MRRSLGWNLFANLAGSGWSALIQIVFVPIYLRLLGVEAYGLIGFYAVTQAIVVALDLGLGQTLNRETARLAAVGRIREARALAIRLLKLATVSGLILGAVFFLAAPAILDSWIHATSLPRGIALQALRGMGVLLAVQWTGVLGQSALLGLQRQVFLNGVRVGVSTGAAVVTTIALWKIRPTIEVYFAAQAVFQIGQTALFTAGALRALSADPSPPEGPVPASAVPWRFAIGMGVINLLGLLLVHLDKLVLTALVPLTMFAHYSLAALAASGLTMISVPIFNAFFPGLSAAVAADRKDEVRGLFHAGAQTVSVFVCAPALILMLFPHEVLLAWTGHPALAAAVTPILRLLAVGTSLNMLMTLPYALQLAHGWTRIGVTLTAGLVAVAAPALWFFVQRWGVLGAACTWPLVNALYLLVGIPWTYRKVLRGAFLPWLMRDVAAPIGAAAVCAVAVRWVVPLAATRWGAMELLALACVLTGAGLLAGSSTFRGRLAAFRAATRASSS